MKRTKPKKASRKPSGAEYARRRRARDEDTSAALFADIELPDFDDPAVLLTWARQTLARVLVIAATQPLTPAIKDRVRLIKDAVAALGLTHARGELEQRMGDVERLISNIRPRGAIQIVEAAGHPRPATCSRGGARRLRPIPADPTDPERKP